MKRVTRRTFPRTTRTPATFGAPLGLDPKSEHFTGENAAAANRRQRRHEYRAPWVVPELA